MFIFEYMDYLFYDSYTSGDIKNLSSSISYITLPLGIMQCVKKYEGKWYITMIALIIYGLSCYFHIMYAKTV